MDKYKQQLATVLLYLNDSVYLYVLCVLFTYLYACMCM